ncbi:MAG TPA: ribosome maturation factor RimP [Nocardioidaceae bacterium]|nr:ribosome maturation factor RimP [Nocardioidaceae bacterium]
MADEETRDRLAGVLTAPLLALGLDLEAVEVTPAGKRRLLRVAVDKDGGVSLDEIAAATKEVSQLLDETDVMGDKPYLLEVSSPGIDRPLTLPRHWRRNASRLVKLTTAANETLTGRITEAGDDSVVLDVNGKTRSIAYADVTKARVQVEFNRKDAEA